MTRLLCVLGLPPDDPRAREAIEATAVASVFDHEVTLLLTGRATTWTDCATDATDQLWPGALVDYGVAVVFIDAAVTPVWAQRGTSAELPAYAAGADRVLSF